MRHHNPQSKSEERTRSQEERPTIGLLIHHFTGAVARIVGQLIGIFGISRDITKLKHVENVLQQRNRELALLNQVGQLFNSTIEWNQVLKTILEEMHRLLNITATSFWVTVPETGELICQQATGPGSETVVGWRLSPGQGIAGEAAQSGKTIIIADTRMTPQHYKGVDKKTGIELRSILSIPFYLKGEVTGVLNLVDTAVNRFTKDDLRIVEPITAAAASAIDNARLYMKAQQEIAERKQAEKALLAAHNQLKKTNTQLAGLNASKDKFFSIISHDLRGPFNIILGYSQLLDQDLERYSQDEIKTLIKELRVSAERLYTLLENLLTWSRIQRGAMDYTPEVIDITDTIEEVLDLFHTKANQKQISLQSALEAETYVYADSQMVATILRNLLSNALKFTPNKGTVTVSAQPHHEQYLQIAVSDTGIGIEEENLSKLFRIDGQYTQTGTAGEIGTGLGLSLCKDLVEKNGGTIWVESEVERGTTFRFTLPK